jgi:His-Xaa-Ser system protein HxsD
VDLEFDLDLYPLDAVMGTAYVFTDRCHVRVDKLSDARVRASLSPKAATDEETMKSLAGEFQNELLAQALRLRVAARHEKVREAIVVRALFGAAPVVPEAAALPSDEQLGVEPQFLPAEGDDYLDDPLGIAIPWEEKYGAKASEKPAGAAPDAPEAPAGGDVKAGPEGGR